MVSESTQEFLKWFRDSGATLHPAVGIKDFEGVGRGAVALHDIQKDTVLFTVPRSILLSTRTAPLRDILGDEDWSTLKGWEGLILSMMYEDSRVKDSPWSGYLQDLPTKFDTLMFWTDEELEQLQASTVRDKIGKAATEKDFHERVLPLLQRRTDVFEPALRDTFFTLERFHINGSRILSRSFHVEEWHDEHASDDESIPSEPDHKPVEMSRDPDAMDTDEGRPEGGEDDDAESDTESPDDVNMVPMADILNARYGCHNAKLFYEKDHLNMIATKDIPAGEQIWNTYGDPPNADLLRQYGHIDRIPILNPEVGVYPFENPADEVEIRADLVFDVCTPHLHGKERTRRIDDWLTLGGEDTFVIDNDDPLCKPLLGIIKFLGMSEQEVDDTLQKDKLPKGKPTGELLEGALQVYKQRLNQYGTALEADEQMLIDLQDKYSRLHNAVFVRTGEKRLLRKAIRQAETILQQEKAQQSKGKRPREETKSEKRSTKKVKR
ncbi:related to SET7-Regulatory protein [Serendipita indica DSM 11827]|uniref:Related to SET7-Regulatory protein n=1 Tax=Serendipita indica (strain DSM 11827) TaxID=1109443 RepID=G4TAI6_SERID|nr:related to SET7-Regulatory protein [Serendipita indica DSM 11827]